MVLRLNRKDWISGSRNRMTSPKISGVTNSRPYSCFFWDKVNDFLNMLFTAYVIALRLKLQAVHGHRRPIVIDGYG